jgi:RNA polymerase sigma factor (sigma-70 family)
VSDADDGGVVDLDADDLLGVGVDSAAEQGDRNGRRDDGEAESGTVTDDTAWHEQTSGLGLETRQTEERSCALAGKSVDLLPDDQLVAGAQQGQPGAFDALYRRHADAVREVARNWVRDRDAVEDAVQETFALALRALPDFQGGDRFEHWLRRIAKRVCIGEFRLRTRWSTTELRPGDGASIDGPEAVTVDRLAVAGVLDRLSQGDASLLVEHHALDVPLTQIAARLDRPEQSLGVAVHRARARFRRLAHAKGLGALAPVPLLQRLARQLTGRFQHVATTPPFAGLATAVEVLIGVAVIAGATVGANGTTVAAAGDAHEQVRGAAAPAPVVAPAEPEVPLEPPAALVADAPVVPASRQAPAHEPDAPAPSTSSEPPKAVMPFTPVDVPGTGRQVSSDAPPSEPDYAYRVEVEAAGQHKSVTVEMHDEQELEAANETACGAVDVSPVGASCARGGDG